MVILQDTREQTPLEFTDVYITDVEKTTLDVGDYMCRFKSGYIPPLAFERKSMGDLFSTLGDSYDRFKREIMRAQEQDIRLIILIEGSILDMLLGTTYSSRPGITVLRQLFTLWIKYNVYFVCFTSRTEMAIYIAECYKSIGRRAQVEQEIKYKRRRKRNWEKD